MLVDDFKKSRNVSAELDDGGEGAEHTKYKVPTALYATIVNSCSRGSCWTSRRSAASGERKNERMTDETTEALRSMRGSQEASSDSM